MLNERQETISVDDLIKEVEYGRCQKQLIGGLCNEEERFYNKPDELEIDTLDILRALKPYEVPLKPYIKDDEEYYKEEWFDIEKYLSNFYRELKELNSGNTYNEAIPISNHINTEVFEVGSDDWFVYAIRIHLHGDVRANYSPYMIFAVTWEECEDAWNNATKTVPIEVDGWKGEITIFANTRKKNVTIRKDDECFEFETEEEYIDVVKERVREEIKDYHSEEVE